MYPKSQILKDHCKKHGIPFKELPVVRIEIDPLIKPGVRHEPYPQYKRK